MTAFRWTFDPITSRCFEPQAVRNPPRFHNEADPEKRCSCWGLSMHVSIAQSIAAFQAVEKGFKKARKTLGDSISQGNIAKADGKCTPADHYGHFDLHLYNSANLLSKFVVVQAIP